MTAVLVDANVLLDVMTEDARWLAWSAGALERAADRYRLVINPAMTEWCCGRRLVKRRCFRTRVAAAVDSSSPSTTPGRAQLWHGVLLLRGPWAATAGAHPLSRT